MFCPEIDNGVDGIKTEWMQILKEELQSTRLILA